MKFYGVLNKQDKWKFCFMAKDTEQALERYTEWLEQNVPVGDKYDGFKLYQFLLEKDKVYDLKELYESNPKLCVHLDVSLDVIMPQRPLL